MYVPGISMQARWNYPDDEVQKLCEEFPGISYMYVPGISIDFQMEERRQNLRLKSVSFLLIFPRKKRRSVNKYIFLAIYRYVEERPKQ